MVKFPKWPFDKFAGISRKLGTQMKATGEVMAIGTSFEAALMKAVRGAEISLDSLNAAPVDGRSVEDRLADRDDRRLFTVFEALKHGVTPEKINEITRIDRFFLDKLQHLADLEKELADRLSPALYETAKKMGYPDSAIRRIAGVKELPASCGILQNGGHLRRGILRRDPVFLFHLRPRLRSAGTRRAPASPA